MPEVDGRTEAIMRAHFRTEANAARPPDGLSARIMNAIHADASANSIEDQLAGALRADAHRVRAPSDMPSRVRNAIRDREGRRLRFQPRGLVAPAIVIACVVGVLGFISLIPQRVNEPFATSSSQSEPDPAVRSPASDEQSLVEELPNGALTPSLIPDGYELADFMKYADASAPFSYRLENGSGGYISIEERSGSPPAGAFEAPTITDPDDAAPSEYKGYDNSALQLARNDSTATIVVILGDRTVTITANQLSDEELVRLARSIESTGQQP